MALRTSTAIGFLCLVVACLWPYATVEAYLPSAAHLLDLMVQNMGRSKSLQVTQNLVIYPSADQPDTPVYQIRETVRYQFGKALRSDAQLGDTQRIYLRNAGTQMVVMDGRLSGQGATRYDRCKELLLYQKRQTLQAQLTRFGIDTSISSLGRIGDKVAFVIGAVYPDEATAQLWLDHETFRPLRWVVTPADAQGRGGFEIRYRQWARSGRRWYPRRMEIFTQGRLAREIEAVSLQPDEPFSESLFSPAQLRAMYDAAASASASSANVSDPLPEVRQTIEEFKRIYE